MVGERENDDNHGSHWGGYSNYYNWFVYLVMGIHFVLTYFKILVSFLPGSTSVEAPAVTAAPPSSSS